MLGSKIVLLAISVLRNRSHVSCSLGPGFPRNGLGKLRFQSVDMEPDELRDLHDFFKVWKVSQDARFFLITSGNKVSLVRFGDTDTRTWTIRYR